jgi:hypothetical protein
LANGRALGGGVTQRHHQGHGAPATDLLRAWAFPTEIGTSELDTLLSCRRLLPGIQRPQTPEQAESWIACTSPAMTIEAELAVLPKSETALTAARNYKSAPARKGGNRQSPAIPGSAARLNQSGAKRFGGRSCAAATGQSRRSNTMEVLDIHRISSQRIRSPRSKL